MKIQQFILTCTVLTLASGSLMSQPIPEGIKSSVSFLYTRQGKNEITPIGTGFFISVAENPSKGVHAYFVTAKHVLREERGKQKKWRRDVYLRLNTESGEAKIKHVPIRVTGNRKTVYLHPNARQVDLAVIPALPNPDKFDFKLLPAKMITKKEDFDELNIREGTEIFFSGLFTPYAGYERSYPIVRFGKVALMTEEKIKWGERRIPMDLYLMEAGSYGGNSGAPVFFYLGAHRKPGKLVLGGPTIKLAGIVIGHFQQPKKIRAMDTDSTPVSMANMGIAAVVPSFKLHEILFGKELQARRKEGK